MSAIARARLASRFETLSAKQKASSISALCGVLGIITGFVLFVVLAHESDSTLPFWVKPVSIAAGLAGAFAMAWIGEKLLKVIRTGKASMKLATPRNIGAVVILLIIFELYASFVEDAARAVFLQFGELRVFAERFIGEVGAGWFTFTLLFLVWCASAASLAIFLTLIVFRISKTSPILVPLKAGMLGAAKALTASVAGLVLALIAVRFALLVGALMFDTERTVASLDGMPPLGPLNLLPQAVDWFRSWTIFGWQIEGWVSLPLTFALLAMLDVVRGDRQPKGVGWGLLGLLAMSVVPIVGGLLFVVLLSVMAWLVPAIGLATLLPFLEPGAPSRRAFGLIAALSGIVLIGGLIVSWWRFDFVDGVTLGFAVVAMAFAMGGIYGFGQRRIHEVWPLLVLPLVFSLAGGTSLVNATFQGVMGEIHPLAARPLQDSGEMQTWRKWMDYLYYGQRPHLEALRSAPTAQSSCWRYDPRTGQAIDDCAGIRIGPAQGQLPQWMVECLQSDAVPDRGSCLSADPPAADPSPSEGAPASETPPPTGYRQAYFLELALVGSLGFWITIGLLAAWSLRRADEAGVPQTVGATEHPSPLDPLHPPAAIGQGTSHS
jgi:hypothetical protein